MSSYEWHTLMAKCMMDIARCSKPIAASYALIVAFEEMVDAYAAIEDKHFHEEYLADAYKKRLEWMNKHNIIDRWYELTHLCNLVVRGRYECIEDIFKIVQDSIYIMGSVNLRVE